jgi:hypothetical protein
VKKRRAPAASHARKRAPAQRKRKAVAAAPVTARELRALRDELEKRLGTATTVAVGKQRTPARRRGTAPMRWNPEPDDVQRSVAQLVLTIVEFLRQLMERQAIRRMEQKTLTAKEVEAVGSALMMLESTIREIGQKFGLTSDDLNLDLGPLGKLI